MVPKITIDGKVDDKPMSHDVKAKVQDALKGALQKEFVPGSIVPNHHFSITHFSVVYDEK